MSFSDLMSSAKGPGVVGTLLALLVVGGFGLLFLLAFSDDGMGGMSIDAYLKKQTEDLNASQARLQMYQSRVAGLPKLVANAKKLDEATANNKSDQAKIVQLQEQVAVSQEALTAEEKVFEDYKNDYRRYIRRKVRGTRMDKLETTDGKVYQDVEIKSVSPIGVQIRHAGGLVGVDYEVLPTDMQDLLQFDEAQKKDALMEIERAHATLSDAANQARQNKEAEQELKRKEQKQQQIAEAIRNSRIGRSKLIQLDGEIQRLEKTLRVELARRKGLSRVGIIKKEIKEKEQMQRKIRAKLDEYDRLINDR